MMSRIARVLACAALAVAPGLLASCGSSTTEATNPVIAIQLSGSTAAVTQGGTQNFTVTLTRTAFTGDVALSASGLPAGVTATFNPATLSGNTLSSTVTLTATADAAPSTNTTVTVHATGTGVTEATGTIGVTVNVAGSYSLGMSPGTVNVAAGASTSSTINITRAGGFNGAVALTVTGAPTGVTATITPASVSVGTNSATLNIVTTGSAAVAQSTLTIHGNSAGTTEQTTTLAVNVTPAAGASVALKSSTLSMSQGSQATDSVTITRAGGFTGAVNLTVTGLPTGVTASFDNASPTGSGAVLTLTATGSATVGGPTAVVVHSNATGIAEATANLGLTVTAPTTASLSLDQNCIGDHPILWMAEKNMNGSWQVVTGSGGIYSMNVTPAFQLAVVQSRGTGRTEMFVGFFTTSEIAPLNGTTCAARSGSSSLSGSIANAPNGAQVQASHNGTYVISNGSYNFSNLPSTVDLVSWISGSGMGPQPPSEIIVRHNVTTGGTAATLDFGTAEAVAPASATITVSNLGTDSLSSGAEVVTSNDTHAFLNGNFGVSTTPVVYGAPASILGSTEVNNVQLQAAASSNASSGRSANLWQHTLANASMTLRSALSTPTVSIAASSPYVMMHVTLALQSDYNVAMQAQFQQDTSRRVQLFETAGWLAVTGGSQWDVTVPDLSSLAGWQNTWGLQTGQTTNWEVGAAGGSLGDMFTNTPADGTVQYSAYMQNSVTTMPPAGTRLPTGGRRLQRSRSARPSVVHYGFGVPRGGR